MDDLRRRVDKITVQLSMLSTGLREVSEAVPLLVALQDVVLSLIDSHPEPDACTAALRAALARHRARQVPAANSQGSPEIERQLQKFLAHSMQRSDDS